MATATPAATELTVSQMTRALEALVGVIGDQLKQNGRIEIPKLGAFETYRHRETRARHPTTRQVVKVPGHKAVRFRPAEDLRRQLAEKSCEGLSSAEA